MDDLDEESVRLGGQRSFFTGPLAPYRWRALLPQTVTGEIGKTLFFAVSRVHATKLARLLNEEAARLYPAQYGAGSDFAVQVTSDIPGAQQMTVDFANNNRNGKSRWRSADFRDYDTSRARVCVTVGMMTTGYDCEDLLNVALARPIFSPGDFIQIKGRGTRLFTFKHGDGAQPTSAPKDNFHLFDFFANCEYFEKDFDYDKNITLPKVPSKGEGGEGPGGGSDDGYVNTSPGPMAGVISEHIGVDGMRVDREMFRECFSQQAGQAVADDPELRAAFDAEDWPAIEARIRRLLFEKPEEYWNLPKLQELYKTDRLPSLREILARVFGLIHEIPTRSQLADEAFERYVATAETDATHSRELRTVFVAFLLDPTSRLLLEQGRFAELRSRDPNLFRSLQRLAPAERDTLIAYLQSQVTLKDFEPVVA